MLNRVYRVLLSVCTVDKSKMEISQKFVALSEYMNFTGVSNYFCNLWQVPLKTKLAGSPETILSSPEPVRVKSSL